MALRTVASYRDGPSAHIAGSVLEAESIPYRILDEHTVGVDWLASQALGGVKIQVPPEFEEQARRLLSEDRSSAVEEGDGPACPECGSRRIGPSRLRRIVGALGLMVHFPLIAWSKRWVCRSCRHRWLPDASQT